MLTCRELTELVTEYLEGQLSLGQRLRFEMHIAMCGHCRAYLRQMKHTVQILGKLPEESVPPDALNELLERFRGWKR
jgi:predicted anti-sigma-YlaC factor YlaD